MRVYSLITLKRKIEELLMWPFVQAGKRWASRHPLRQEYDIFCFFPFYVLGGAEKVNAEVVGCFPDKKVMIFFTKKSGNDKMLHLFRQPHVQWQDISRYADNKRRYWNSFFYRGVCAYYINQQVKAPVVFNGQCNFGYKLFPHLRKSILKLELIHNSYKHFAWITFPYVPFIDKRVMVADNIMNDHKRFYDELGIPARFKDRMIKILYKIDKPMAGGPRLHYGEKLKVYYAGRGGFQKRVWLIDRIATKCIQKNLPLEFHFAGNFKEELSPFVLQHAIWHGEIAGGEAMTSFHQQMDVLLMTSAFEGFPLVLLEGMINGVVPILTAVDGVLEHISHGENGLLMGTPADEEAVVSEAVQNLVRVCENRDELKRMSASAFRYAFNNFQPEKFCQNYRRLFEMEEK